MYTKDFEFTGLTDDMIDTIEPLLYDASTRSIMQVIYKLVAGTDLTIRYEDFVSGLADKKTKVRDELFCAILNGVKEDRIIPRAAEPPTSVRTSSLSHAEMEAIWKERPPLKKPRPGALTYEEKRKQEWEQDLQAEREKYPDIDDEVPEEFEEPNSKMHPSYKIWLKGEL